MRSALLVAALAFSSVVASGLTQQPSPDTGPVIVLETVKGVIEIETYVEDAPKTVARIVELVKRNFYNGQRFHRVVPNQLVQIGDPVSRDMSKESWWGRAGSGKPLGVAEISKRRRHVRGAVSMAHTGDPKLGDSQFFVALRAVPQWDGKYVVFGRVTKGMNVVERLQKTDMLRKASVKAETPAP